MAQSDTESGELKVQPWDRSDGCGETGRTQTLGWEKEAVGEAPCKRPWTRQALWSSCFPVRQNWIQILALPFWKPLPVLSSIPLFIKWGPVLHVTMIPQAMWLPRPKMPSEDDKQGLCLEEVYISDKGCQKIYNLFIICLPMSYCRLPRSRDICLVAAYLIT